MKNLAENRDGGSQPAANCQNTNCLTRGVHLRRVKPPHRKNFPSPLFSAAYFYEVLPINSRIPLSLNHDKKKGQIMRNRRAENPGPPLAAALRLPGGSLTAAAPFPLFRPISRAMTSHGYAHPKVATSTSPANSANSASTANPPRRTNSVSTANASNSADTANSANSATAKSPLWRQELFFIFGLYPCISSNPRSYNDLGSYRDTVTGSAFLYPCMPVCRSAPHYPPTVN